MKILISCLITLFFFTSTGYSSEKTELKPFLNKRTKLLNKNVLKKGEGESGHGKDWLQGYATWELTDDGVFKGRRTQDEHAAGLRSHIGVLPDKTILEFQFKFDSSAKPEDDNHRLNVRYMGKGKALVLAFSPFSIVLRTMNKEGKYDILAKKATPLKKDIWYSVILEIRDEECCLQMNGDITLKGRHQLLKERTKKFMVFNANHSQSSIKNVKLWESE